MAGLLGFFEVISLVTGVGTVLTIFDSLVTSDAKRAT